MLTAGQMRALKFLDAEIARTGGIPPTVREMQAALGMKSRRGAYRILVALEERGFIRRLPNRARAIEILRRPGEALQLSAPAAGPMTAPLWGRIAAGTPLFAIQGSGETVSTAPFTGITFALDMVGGSMIEAGIFDGDRLLFVERPEVAAGDIVLAVFDEKEATVARIRRRQGGMLALKKANPAYLTRIIDARRIRIAARLVGVMRRFPDRDLL